MLRSRRTFPRLNRGDNNLFSAFNKQDLRTKLIIKYDDKNGFYKFTVFESPWELYQHIFSLPKYLRTFFEVVTNLTCRKPHFDIDFVVNNPKELDDIDVISEVVSGCQKVMNNKLDLAEDIIVLQSHGWKEKAYKVSYHIIIDNYYLQTEKHAKEFCKNVMACMNDYHEYIDDKIYSSIRQFRLIGNCKYKSNRFLHHVSKWNYFGTPITSIKRDDYRLFFSTLVGVTGHCQKIEIELPKKELEYNSHEARDDEVSDAMEKLHDYFKTHDIEAEFRVRDVQNSLIILDRVESSLCPVCNVIHDSENPYLILTKDKEVLFNCRRSDRFINIGDVKYFDDDIELEDEVYFFEEGSLTKAGDNSNTKKIRRRTKKTPIPIGRSQVVETICGYLSSSDEESFSS